MLCFSPYTKHTVASNISANNSIFISIWSLLLHSHVLFVCFFFNNKLNNRQIKMFFFCKTQLRYYLIENEFDFHTQRVQVKPLTRCLEQKTFQTTCCCDSFLATVSFTRNGVPGTESGRKREWQNKQCRLWTRTLIASNGMTIVWLCAMHLTHFDIAAVDELLFSISTTR